jgi:putative serine protease PepD
MSQSPPDPPTPPGAPSGGVSTVSPARMLAAVIVAALVGGVVGGAVVRATTSGSTAAGSSATAEPTATATASASADVGVSEAMCHATTVAAQDLPSVVTITARSGSSGGTGTGEIVRSGGYILTNNHVIAVAATGGQISVLYSDGRTSDATLVGRDPVRDLAVIKAADGASGLPVIGIGSSQALVEGQPVVAMGAPLGLSSTVTSGIVSALDRYISVPGDAGQTAHLVGAIQTDAAINPGNSGGPLVDCAGRLVGVNSAIATVPNSAGQSGGGSVGLGFAIPVDLADRVASEIIATGTVTHLTLGLNAQAIPPAAAQKAGVPEGLYVLSVTPGGPAATAGLASGDVITEVDGKPATSSEQITVAELTAKPGQAVSLTYARNGSSTTVKVTPVAES